MIASGRAPPGITEGDLITSWLTPTSLLGGTLAMLACAYLAPVYRTRDAERDGDVELIAWFRRRALATGIVIGGVAIGGIVVLEVDVPDLARGLTGRGLPLVALSGIAGSSRCGPCVATASWSPRS